MVSYAPLLANVSGRTGWHGMIYFDSLRSYATVSYHLWKLFGLNRPDYTVATDVDYHAAEPPAIAGAVGIGTWNNSAEFKDVRVEQEGKFLAASDFTNTSAGWKTDDGDWTRVDGAFRQRASNPNGLIAYIGDETWSNYTVTLKARKVGSQGEGFLIAFGKKGADKYWWNVGGYGNTQHDVEFNQTILGRTVRAALEPDRWYDVKIVLTGRRIQCFLDGQQIHDITVPAPDRFFVNAGRDEARGEMVIKAINVSPDPVASTLHVAGLSQMRSEGQCTILSSSRLSDNNTMEEPDKVIPVAGHVKLAGESFTYDFPPNSFTLIRFKAK
jgi:hypothetical protein